MEENKEYLNKHIITYIGNKRKLLDFIGNEIEIIKRKLKKDKLICFDGFSGSGIVSRFLKRHSKKLYTNDLEDYSVLINKCFLTNKSEVDFTKLRKIVDKIENLKIKITKPGIVSKYYSPDDDNDIKEGERVFYTCENALIIDNIRTMLDKIKSPYKELVYGVFLSECSVHTNTSGVFKGFYKNKETGLGCFGGTAKNCLSRITSPIKIEVPILSNFECEYEILKGDTNKVVKEIDEVFDVAYYDPPYNQHPYGSNYFMLNLIIKNEVDDKKISKVSGIPEDWNKSNYNKKSNIKNSFDDLIKNTKSKFIIVSYSNEGFLSEEEIVKILSKYGNCEVKKQEYSAFKASRNLHKRNKKVQEILFILEKDIIK